MEQNKLDFEYFLLDTELNAISIENNPEKLEAYIEKYSGHRDMISDAFTLLQNLKVNPAMVSQTQIDMDYDLLFKEITQRQRKTRSLRLTIGSVAACACLVLGFSLFFNRTGIDELQRTSQMLSLLNEVTINTDEVQIISGSTTTQIENNETITQTEDGNLMVGEKEKVKSADLETELVQLVVPHGKRTNIKFHDGTMAWLNSGSKLIYPKVFAADKREIYIEGEIYLEVEKSKEKPFIVHAKMFDVEVLGTKFNLSAYSEDTENSVVLVEGSVDVKTEAHKQRLVPSQGYFSRDGAARVKKVDTYTYTCWRDGVMIVDGESLDNMFARLARHYNVNIKCDEQTISTERYKGKLNLHDSLEEVLRSLSASLSFTYKKGSGDEIQIHMRK
ncbi:FecR family protein [Bacteroides sp. 51]|uniref:FecR family protein n=1 Tax=Bacteroides sp. 51 TaxID=2302938 RepID=UPI0013CFF1F1|nr:FecR domain-containing protein [Bacteroides sp. 51]NDV80502.1 FecR family protein [Bacteroides sp. 51]